MYDVGEVSAGDRTIRWTIPGYMEKRQEVDSMIWSPDFIFFGDDCVLGVFPNGLKHQRTEGWMGIGLETLSLPSNSKVNCCLVNREGSKYLHTVAEWKGSSWNQYKWILQRELQDRSEELLPRGELSILIRVVLPDEEEHSAQEEAGSHEDEIERSESNVSNSSRHIHEGHSNLSRNFKDLYIQGTDSDLLIQVKDRQFGAHRLVLKARIPAFAAMLSHDMAENREGVLRIEDCHPDVFNEFLLFIYSGTVENLTPENMCGLYVLADKYGLQDLKAVCLDFIKASISIETVCDVVSLASTHREAELLRLATDYFVAYAKQILVTVKWQLFLAEKPTEANELFLKALTKGE